MGSSHPSRTRAVEFEIALSIRSSRKLVILGSGHVIHEEPKFLVCWIQEGKIIASSGRVSKTRDSIDWRKLVCSGFLLMSWVLVIRLGKEHLNGETGVTTES